MAAAEGRFAAALAQLGACLGIDDISAGVTFQAREPSLATRFAAAEGAAAALAAGAATVRRIAAGRGLAAGDIRLDSRQVEASLLSFAHLHFEDPAKAPPARIAPEQRTAVAGFQQAGDGRWVYLHPGFPHNTQGLLTLLGVGDDRAAVQAAVARYGAAEVEDAMAAAGLCGAMVRSPGEWDASTAGALLGARPVVEVIQLGDSDPEPLPGKADRPLDDVRVLDLTRVLAGPTCARTLASYGAGVLRIGAAHLPTIERFVADTGFGKRFAQLDLNRPDAAQTLRRLLRDADVLSQSYRTGALERLGFGVTDAVQIRPGLIYVSINCYGHEGAWRARPGWEQLAQTVTGLAHEQGVHRGEDRPALLPAAVTDYTTGYLAALGSLAALERRARLGGSYWVRVSLARTGMWLRGLGRRDDAAATPAGADELAGWQGRMAASHWGALRYLRPAVEIGGVATGWVRPPAPPGSDPAGFEDPR